MRNIVPLILSLLLGIFALSLYLSSPNSSEETSKTASEKAQTSSDSTAPQLPPNINPWPQEASDIPADPAAKFGVLENGFRYIILPNEEPPGRLSIRLHIAAGSLMEAEDQRGLAHFLEHMVFNGTKNYKDANSLIRDMQTRGIAFGAHVNAYTSFDETVYMLDLPDLKTETLDLSFGIMRDFGDGALLSTEEIDAERGVILAEKASRDSVSYRMMQQQFSALLPGSLIAERFPIGIKSVIESAPRERFVDFYKSHYIPEKMTFIVVGNIDPDEIEKRISSSFASMRNPDEIPPAPDLGDVASPEGIVPHVFSDPEISSTDVSLTLVRKYIQKPDTTENRSAEFPIQIANSILSRRFERLAKEENSPITSGSAAKYSLFNSVELGSVSVEAADDRWMDATPLLEQGFRRALTHGFTEAEVAEARANLLNAYEEMLKQKETRKSETIASAIARAINDEEVFSTPEKNLEIASAALAKIDAASAAQAFNSFWKAPGLNLVLSTNKPPENAAPELLSTFEASTNSAVEPPAARELAPFAYTDFGPAGSVATTNEVADLGITQLVLSNQIRVNLKPTSFQKNRIRFLANIGTGQLSQAANTPLLNSFATAVFEGGGLGKHSNDELAEILAGRNVSSSLSSGEDSLTLSGSSTPEDQLLQLQIMAASLTDPGYRPEALWAFQKTIPALFQSLRHTTSGPMTAMNEWLHGGDFRYAMPDQTILSNYSIEDAKSYLDPQLQNAPIELSIVGDFTIENILPDILSTFGTLSKRPVNLPETTQNPRTTNFPKAPAEKTFTYSSKVPQAVAIAIWKTSGIRGNIPEFRRLNILSEIFGDRLREEIREKLGASYSPGAGATGSPALEDFGYLIGQSTADPADVPRLLETMQTISTDLAENGASQDELDRALAPTLSSLQKSLRDNSYWLGTVIAGSQANPEKLDLARSRDEDYSSIQLEEINRLAAKYFDPENLIKISILPEETE